MVMRRLKTWYFVIEGVNSFVTTFFFYYLYFFMQARHGFDTKANLSLAAFTGLVYAIGSWLGGRFAQRAGYFTALKLGFSVMIGAILFGWASDSGVARVCAMSVAVAGMCLTWPALEALVSENESKAGIQHHVGIYNIVWASTGALAYFTGGALVEKLGAPGLFGLPVAIVSGLLALTLVLERAASRPDAPRAHTVTAAVNEPDPAGHCPGARAKTFLHMAWVANPFAYMAINTLVAAMPTVALRLELSPMEAGFYCSTWLFARVIAFGLLWAWPGWHYRAGWLFGAVALLIASFAIILTVPNLACVVAAQLVFGSCTGLIYYSSLFYAMDLGETKGEHGGLHEAAIGAGNCAGPLVGAAALQFLPQYAHSGAIAVSVLLLAGFGALVFIWRRRANVAQP
ncbi:MAG: hypothetical protein NZ739_05350 [Verrucomicrobiae bacterium]|nr:hypothetical protein [Verrucomicrobiae bacterium]